MAKHQSHSIEFKRQVARAFISVETLHAPASRHDVSRANLSSFASFERFLAAMGSLIPG
jgi:hypothetical protein